MCFLLQESLDCDISNSPPPSSSHPDPPPIQAIYQVNLLFASDGASEFDFKEGLASSVHISELHHILNVVASEFTFFNISGEAFIVNSPSSSTSTLSDVVDVARARGVPDLDTLPVILCVKFKVCFSQLKFWIFVE
jgi:hypothetical protein